MFIFHVHFAILAQRLHIVEYMNFPQPQFATFHRCRNHITSTALDCDSRTAVVLCSVHGLLLVVNQPYALA